MEQPERIADDEFFNMVEDIKQMIKSAQYRALQTVNQEQIALYWSIGKSIVDRQQAHGWGKSIVERLAGELQQAFPNTNGYSSRNLWRMKNLYEEYSSSDLILPPVVAEIAWSHNIIILEKCKDAHQRFFYIKMAARHHWSKTALTNAIAGQLWENMLLNQHNFEETLPAVQIEGAASVIRDEYTFGFLHLSEPYTEAQLEQALLNNIRDFLASMGGDFTFVGNQVGVTVDGKHFEIDLLLYHRSLQCLVAIDLKIDEFQPEYAGKMNFYLSALNRLYRKPHEQPSIGIIICKSKSRTVVEFALQDVNKPIGIATYTLTESLPKELSQFFPTSQELAERVEALTKNLKNNRDGGRQAVEE
ncbi:MAG: PDDEXK nuclease domain-containing protein [Saprospiraceae bacterium]|jgi:predicted nuclease of restriction endonuclease-like (RecB) superfamily